MHDRRHGWREDDVAREPRAVTWKEQIHARLVQLRLSRPARLLERVVWWIVG